MAKYRGHIDHERVGSLDYEVTQYKMIDNDRFYVRGATPEKLDSSDIEWVRIEVTNPDTGESKHMQLWGPYLSRDVIEGELDAAFHDDDYAEAVGA